MKKYINYSLLFIIALMLIIPINVSAKSCADYKANECNGSTNDNGVKCTLSNVNGTAKCTEVSSGGTIPSNNPSTGSGCESHGINDCTSYKDSNGNSCVVAYTDESGKGTSPCCVSKGNVCGGKIAEDNKSNGEDYDNYNNSGDLTCGNGLTFNKSIVNVTYYFVLVFQIFGPVALIIWGMIDLFKGVVAGKDDEIKKAQGVFIKRLTTALIMFLVITIVRFLLSIMSTDTIIDCFNCFVNGAKKCK